MNIQTIPIVKIQRAKYNPRKTLKPGDPAYDKLKKSFDTFGLVEPLVWNQRTGNLVGGHQRLSVIEERGDAYVDVSVVDLSDRDEKALNLALNRHSGEWDFASLADMLTELKVGDFDMEITGFDAAELEKLMASGPQAIVNDVVPDLPKSPITKPGDLWMMGSHRLMCGDSRKQEDVLVLTGGVAMNLVVTSPPYASQRKYDESSGFRPIAPNDYVEWFASAAANIKRVLAPDGSYFLNIKEHCDDGQRVLYVKDLTLAHVRMWNWRFIDEFCWRDTANGVPGGWPNRFKDAWEPVFQYSTQGQIKFRPDAVSTETDSAFDYSPKNTKTHTGSGLLGAPAEGRRAGRARPSNVLEIASSSLPGHSAMYPVSLPAFFIQAYTDAGDSIFDPFMGGGSTLIATEQLGRVGYGMEISPAYCDVIVERWQNLTGKKAELSK